MKRTDAIQLAFKRETDPKGLLNPGKMIAWENRSLISPPGAELPLPRPRGAGARGAGLSLILRILVLFAHPVETSFASGLHGEGSSRSCARKGSQRSTIAISMPRASIR